MKNSAPGKHGTLTSVCCVCGSHLRGPWPPIEDVSHGYCEGHLREAMRNIEEFARNRKAGRMLAALAA